MGPAQTYADARGRLAEIGRTSAIDLAPERTGLPGATLAQANVSHLGRGRPPRAPPPPAPARPLVRRLWAGVRRARGRPPVLADPGARPLVETREIAADDWVEIPAGVAHGFLALEPLTLVYVVTNEYDGTDELGFAWDDPDAAVPWPNVPGTHGRPPDPVRPGPRQPAARELAARIRGAAGNP